MLEGVEILSTYTGYIKAFNFTWFFAIIIAALITGIICSIIVSDYEVIVLCLIAGTFIGAAVGIINERTIGEYPIYKITVSEDVNFTEFNDAYEILEQDGKIYTIKERDEK